MLLPVQMFFLINSYFGCLGHTRPYLTLTSSFIWTTKMEGSWERLWNWLDNFVFKLHASGLQIVAQALVLDSLKTNAYCEWTNQDRRVKFVLEQSYDFRIYHQFCNEFDQFDQIPNILSDTK